MKWIGLLSFFLSLEKGKDLPSKAKTWVSNRVTVHISDEAVRC